jgi:broad specificity phosphatase PhoE
VARRLQGRGDSPLTDIGRAQAEGHLAWLRPLAPEALLASPLGRVRATVDIIAPALGLEAAYDETLSERCMGEFEGWSLDEIADRHPGEHALRERDPWRWRPPGGENYDDMMARTAPLVARLMAAPVARLLVVSHGTIVRPILGQLLDLDPATIVRVMAPNDLGYHVDLTGDGTRPRNVRRYHGGEVVEGLMLRGD